MSDNKEAKGFLATTNIEEFWDLNKNILFAGEWCLREKRNKYKDLKYEIIPFQWNSESKTFEAQKYCEYICDIVLEKLTLEYNKKFSLKKDKNFYKIIFGYWLIHFVHQAYDKYSLIKLAAERNRLDTICLSDQSYIIPKNFKEFDDLSNNDYFQLQLFSQIIKKVDFIDYKIKKINFKNKKIITKNLLLKKIKKIFKDISFKLLNSIFNLSNYFYDEIIVISNPYFKEKSKKFILKIYFKSKGKIIFDFLLRDKINNNQATDIEFRKAKTQKSSSFVDLVYDVVKESIPKCYLEDFNKNLEFVGNLYKKLNKIRYTFFTYQSLYNNYTFQYFVALNRDKIKLFSSQHGCGYGMDKFHVPENFDRSIVDKFLTYGWTEGNLTHPLPMPLLIKKKKKIVNENRILLALTTRSVYVIRLLVGPKSSMNLIDHIDDPIKFIKQLNYTDFLYARFHPSDKERWNNELILKNKVPNLKPDNEDSFYKSLDRSRIFVSDSLGTSFLESMQSNTPTVIFINKNSYLFRDSFLKHVSYLRKAKILFFSPIEAANHINEVYNNIDNWWNSDITKKIRNNFCLEHSLTSTRWINDWVKILDNK